MIEHDRTKHIGSSDIAGILGVSKYATPLDIYNRKIYPEKIAFTEKQLALFERGKRAEPLIRSFIEDELGFKFAEVNKQIYAEDNNLLTCELDAETQEGLHYEIKSANAFMKKTWGEGIDDIPLEYLCQVYWAMGIKKAKICKMAVMIDFDIKYYDIPQNQELFEAFKIKALEFWNNHIIPKIPPMPKNCNDLYNLYPNSEGTKEANPQIINTIEYLKFTKLKIKELTQEKEQLEYQIKEYFEDKESLLFDNKTIATFKIQQKNEFVVKASSTKVLRIK